jgi:MYXO-CTERM domain-containing protein
VGEPLNVSLPAVFAPQGTFWASPVAGETVTVNVTGAGISFGKTYSAMDWNNGGAAADLMPLTPTTVDTIGFTMTFEGMTSNLVTLQTFALAGACQPCKKDSDCQGAALGNGLACNSGICNVAGQDGCTKDPTLCGSYACVGGNACACPGSPAAGSNPMSGSKSGCSVGRGGAAAPLCVGWLALVALALAGRRRGR